MDKIEGVSREMVDYMVKNVFVTRKLCQDCRTFLFYNALEMKCGNPYSAKYKCDVAKFDSCPEWDKKIDD